jgi:transketolase
MIKQLENFRDMKFVFAQELVSLARTNPDIVLLTADLGYMVFEEFAHLYPKQFINVGDCEANMVGVGAGLALSGKKVFVYSIATFSTLRPYEQIRNDVCQHKLPVIVVGSGAGLAYGDNGPSHYAVEDIAALRLLPHMGVLCPCDPVETRWAVRECVRLYSPQYLRLGRGGEPVLHTENTRLQIGRGSVLRTGDDYALIATGTIVGNVLEAHKLLLKHGLKGSVISMHTIKPFDSALVLELARKVKVILSVEEHVVMGGLGSAVAEVLAESDVSVRFSRVGLPNHFPESVGSQQFLRSQCGLAPEQIAMRVVEQMALVGVGKVERKFSVGDLTGAFLSSATLGDEARVVG